MDNPFYGLIEQAKKEIRRDIEDLDRLKRRYPGYDFIAVSNREATPTAAPVQVAASKVLSAIEQAALDVVASDPREWTSREVMTALRESGTYRLPDGNDAAMNSVGLALTALKDANLIQRVHDGRGRDPHRYRRLPATEKEALTEEKAS